MAAATYATLTGLSNLSVQFSNDVSSLSSYYAAWLDQIHELVRIQDPAFPEDPTKRIWHPNIVAVFSSAQMAQMLDLYNHVVAVNEFWNDFIVVDAGVTANMFDITPQLDAFVADINDIIA